MDGLILLLGGEVNQKPMLSLMLSDEAVTSGVNASEVIRTISREIKGGGGGQPFYATAGGKDLAGLDNALQAGRDLIYEKLNLPA